MADSVNNMSGRYYHLTHAANDSVAGEISPWSTVSSSSPISFEDYRNLLIPNVMNIDEMRRNNNLSPLTEIPQFCLRVKLCDLLMKKLHTCMTTLRTKYAFTTTRDSAFTLSSIDRAEYHALLNEQFDMMTKIFYLRESIMSAVDKRWINCSSTLFRIT